MLYELTGIGSVNNTTHKSNAKPSTMVNTTIFPSDFLSLFIRYKHLPMHIPSKYSNTRDGGNA